VVALDRRRGGARVSARRRLWLLLPAAVLAAAVALPVDFRSPVPLCAVKALTGLDCPGCGMTRAFILIGHGRLADGFRMHPLAPLAFLIVAAYAVVGAARALGQRSTRTEDPPCTATPADRRSPRT
jgi:hypothetical protein